MQQYGDSDGGFDQKCLVCLDLMLASRLSRATVVNLPVRTDAQRPSATEFCYHLMPAWTYLVAEFWGFVLRVVMYFRCGNLFVSIFL